MLFRDRVDAGGRLADELRMYANDETAAVLAIPRGAVVIGAEIARELVLPLDIVVVRKLGAPENPEFAAGAVDEDGNIIRNPSAGVSMDYLQRVGERERAEIARRLAEYRGGRPGIDPTGRTVLLVDDGIATGFTARAAARSLRARGVGRIVLAVPVAARDAAEMLRAEVDELVALDTPTLFFAVSRFYQRFPQVSDAEVVRILEDERARREGSP